MKPTERVKVRVSLASEGYRDTARTTEIELASIERDEVSLTTARSDDLQDPARFRRPTIVAIASMLPILLLLIGSLPDRGPVATALVWSFFGAIGVGIWAATYMNGQRVYRRLADVAGDAPDVEQRTTVMVRRAQTLTLVGRRRRDESGEEREMIGVRVEESVVDQHKTLCAEYADGSRGVLLADLSEEELQEVCACARTHELEVL